MAPTDNGKRLLLQLVVVPSMFWCTLLQYSTRSRVASLAGSAVGAPRGRRAMVPVKICLFGLKAVRRA
jgi:hypothetical protein